MAPAPDFDAIRAEVAKRHNVLLDHHDPVLVTVTVSELVLAHYANALGEHVETVQHHATATAAKQVEAAKESAGRIITEAANFVADQVRKAASDATAKAREEASRELDAVRIQLNNAQQVSGDVASARRIAVIASVVAAVSAVVAIATLLVMVAR